MKLLCESNLLMVRERTGRKVNLHIEPTEKREIIELVNEVSYYLYDHYRTAYFADANDIADETIARQIGWPARKVGKYRVELQKANLIRITRIGSGSDVITKLQVGMDIVALAEAGLPDNIQDHTAFRKLKRELGISTTAELLENIDQIQHIYQTNPEEFT